MMPSREPVARELWAPLIPHAGAMCLLDEVVGWDDSQLRAYSDGLLRADHPLRGSHGLHAVHLAEYGAQAMAVHAALEGHARGESARAGWLVSLREVELAVEYVIDGRLDVQVDRIYADSAGAQYAFRVESAGSLLAAGRAAVLHRD